MNKNSFVVYILISLFFTVCTLSQSKITLKIVNKNQSISDPMITFVQSLNAVAKATKDTAIGPQSTTSLNGPALVANATINGKDSLLENGVAYKISQLKDSLISMNPDWAGNIFFSDDTLALGKSGQGINFQNAPFYPTDPNGAVLTDKSRYNYIELAGGSTTSINPDITYINYYSVPIQMDAPNGSRGMPSSSSALSSLLTNLAALSNSNENVIVKNGDTIARVISPDNGATAYRAYPSFSTYVTTFFDADSPSVKLNNLYAGIQNPPNSRFYPQHYSTDTVRYDGTTLTIKGSTTPISPDSAYAGPFTMTTTITPDQFSDAIYAAVIDYTVIYGTPPDTVAGQTGTNDVFSAVSRDLLAGFNFGFIGSSKYGNEKSSVWMTLKVSDAFANAQPNNKYYNTWAEAVSTVFPDVYDFPFNDYLKNFTPEMSVTVGDTLKIILLNP